MDLPHATSLNVIEGWVLREERFFFVEFFAFGFWFL